jgi:hypothetical protein
VRELQTVIGKEARAQMIAQSGSLPDAVISCVGGGSNAIGMFHPFIGDKSVEIIGIEAGGTGKQTRRQRRDTAYGRPVCSRVRIRCCCRTRMARSRKRTPSPRDSTIPAWARSIRCCFGRGA